MKLKGIIKMRFFFASVKSKAKILSKSDKLKVYKIGKKNCKCTFYISVQIFTK
jgi:hypothetical protein